MFRKVRIQEKQKRPEYQRQKYKNNRCGQCGAPNWSRQHICPARTVDCRNCRKKGHYGNMCRLPRKTQYVDKASSSADEDNWDYSKMQSINNNEKERGLLSRNIIGQKRTNRIHNRKWISSYTNTTKLDTNYKDINDNKIEFFGQTKATVRTNNTTLQLPLLNTKANIIPLI